MIKQGCKQKTDLKRSLDEIRSEVHEASIDNYVSLGGCQSEKQESNSMRAVLLVK